MCSILTQSWHMRLLAVESYAAVKRILMPEI